MTTDSDGGRILTIVETALLGEETRSGVPLVWVQTEIQAYVLSSAGAREASGDRTVVQALVERRVLAAGTFGGLDNVRRFGRELIYQVGNEPPTRISGAGQLAAAVAAMAGVNTTPVLTPEEQEAVTIGAGRFDTHRVASRFHSNASLLGQSVSVDMQGTLWLSPAVPFGFVKSESTEHINGVASSTRAELIAYGTSGAASKITGTPRSVEIPPELRGILGSLQGLFGGS